MKALSCVELHEESTELITNCGDDNDLLEIDYINLNPDPPVRGEILKIEFKGNLKEQVDDGAYVLITVKYGLVQLLKKKFDFCEEIVKVDEQCPLEKGKLVFNKDVELPKEIPPQYFFSTQGKYTVEAQIFTNDDKRVTCLHGVTSFPRY
ncbi:MD-2-related lipid-recognition domain-containing protein [Gongronella butleri]|nr:MD-2-related lipid-recognition domain-containing protein [Gongronella butleri]